MEVRKSNSLMLWLQILNLALTAIIAAKVFGDPITAYHAARRDVVTLTDPQTVRYVFADGLPEPINATMPLLLRFVVNSLSENPRVADVRQVEPGLWAIDIRDVSNPKGAGSSRWIKAWDEVGKIHPYLPPYGDEIQHLTKSAYPIIRADWFIRRSFREDYNRFLFDGSDLASIHKQFRVDVDANVTLFDIERQVGIANSRVAINKPRQINRFQTIWPGGFWTTRDTVKATSVFDAESLVTIKFDAGEHIFSLPNGLHAYAVTAGKDQKLQAFAAQNVAIDYNTPLADKTIYSGHSCVGCHFAESESGLQPFRDSIRAHIDAGRIKTPNKDLAAKLASLYEGLDSRRTTDNASHRAALNVLFPAEREAPHRTVGAMVTAFFVWQMDAPVQRKEAIRELGINEEKWISLLRHIESRYGQIDGDLIAIDAGQGIHRELWEKQFQRLLELKYDQTAHINER